MRIRSQTDHSVTQSVLRRLPPSDRVGSDLGLYPEAVLTRAPVGGYESTCQGSSDFYEASGLHRFVVRMCLFVGRIIRRQLHHVRLRGKYAIC
jgi:hypothetical protein